MTINNILANANNAIEAVLGEKKDVSISLVNEKPFYIEPNFIDIHTNSNARIVIISAPGAAGKSALSKYIAYKYKALLWDLSKIQLGDNSYMGTLYRSIDENYFSQYVNGVKLGKAFMVIDAFDEAIISSGKRNVGSLIKDIADMVEVGSGVSFVLMARTEASLYIAEMLGEYKIDFSRYEISYIPELNAREFILENIKRHKTKVDEKGVLQCIDKQFKAIKEMLHERSDTFLGYPPVLEALSADIYENNNHFKLGKEIEDKRKINRVLSDIMDDLLDREKNDKVINGLKNRWGTRFKDFNEWDKLYTPSEQLCRVMEYLLLGTVGEFYDVDCLNGDIKDDYLASISEFVKMHPFVSQRDGDCRAFESPAFRDYTIAKLLASDDYSLLVDEYCNKFKMVPSELMIDCFDGSNPIPSSFFDLFYTSAKAKERADNRVYVTMITDNDSTEVSFVIRDNGNNVKQQYEFLVYPNGNLALGNVSDAYIDYPGNALIGKNKASAEIKNSFLNCSRVIFDTEEIVFISQNTHMCVVECESIDTAWNNPIIHCYSDNKSMLQIKANNANHFHEFIPYCKETENDNAGLLIEFAQCVEKINDCMRKHHKDVPAKDKEYIDNEIIAQSQFKKSVLDFLKAINIIYVDNKDTHEYKLNVQKLKEYGLGWQSLQQFGTEKFKILFNEYCIYSNNDSLQN